MSKKQMVKRTANNMIASARLVLVFALLFAAVIFGSRSKAVDAGSNSGGRQVSVETPAQGESPESPQSQPTTFSNQSPIFIPDTGDGSPYPSVLTVNAQGRKITKIVVRLRALSHGRMDDLDVYLMAPNGVGTMLMSDAGGTSSIDQLFIEFDQAATNTMPDGNGLPSGTGAGYSTKPVNYENFNVDVFDPPGPGTDPNFAANLDVFNGIDPNGDWKLFVVDDTTGQNGLFAGGWDLILTLDDLVVNATDDTVDPERCTPSHCNLREAILDAPNGGRIFFSPLFNTPQTINLEIQPVFPPVQALTFTKSLRIEGPGAQLLTIAGGHATNSLYETRVFELTDPALIQSVTLSGMTITGGYVPGQSGGGGLSQGGAIYSRGSLTLNNCVVTGNLADSGAAIYSDFFLTMNGTSITNNIALSTSAGTSAAIYSEGGLAIDNSTISGNRMLGSPANSAGAIYTTNVSLITPQITNSTITNNVALGMNSAGGIYSEGGFVTLALQNNIIAKNNPNTAVPDVVGTFNSAGYNLIGNRGASVFSGTGDQSGTAQLPLDPQLAPLRLWGGTTPTHALLTTSPALDKGFSIATTDQRGFVRPADFPNVPNAHNGEDIGSYEAGNTLVVNKIADTNDGACSPADCSLREAVAAASSGSTIYFSTLFNTPKTITLTSGEIGINKDLTMIGPGANLLSISGNTLSRIFTTGSTGNFNVILQGLTLANGLASAAGGAITNNGNLTVSQCHITQNIGTLGGGIFNGNSGTLTVFQSTISNNAAINSDTGGGIDSRGTLNVLSSTISGNSATVGSNNAGGIRFAGTTSTTRARIEHSTITKNTAAGSGSASGLRRTSGVVNQLFSTIVAGNLNNSTMPDVVETGAANITSRFDLIGNPGTITFGGGSRVGTAANPLDPQLFSLANNGGGTPTHAIASPSSPALQSGNVWLFDGPQNDQRGFIRNYIGADIGAFEAQGGFLPSIGVTDVSQSEGNSGTTNFTFTVSLSAADPQTISVNYATADGSAMAGSDYTALPLTTLTFTPGQTSKTVSVAVSGDMQIEPNETFFLNLSNATNANIADNQGLGTIVNDDQPATLTVVNANDSGAGSLRQAIAAADVGSTIVFDPGFFGTQRTISLTSGELAIAKNLTITGPGANLLTVSGGNVTRVFNISGAVTVNISALTVSAGNSGGNAGGGLQVVTGTLNLADSVVTSCSSNFGGGGVYVSGGTVNIARSLLNGNTTTGGGGALNLSSGGGSVTNSTLSTNNADFAGGGIYASVSSNLQVTSSTIANNISTAGSGGGVYVTDTAAVNLRNTLVSGNTTPNLRKEPAAPSSAIMSQGFNLSSDAGGGYLTGTGDKINANAALGALVNNGGPTRTHALLAGSAALDAGSNATGGFTTDQRSTGFARQIHLSGFPNPGDGTDIGAYEAQSAPVGSPTPTATPTSTFTATPTSTPTATPTSTPCGGTFSYTGPTVPITDNAPVGVNFTIPVSGGESISDVNFSFDGTQSADPASTTPGVNHSFVGDIVVKITSPAGTTVAAFDRPGVPATSFGCSSNNLAQITLDDDGGFPAVESQCATDTTAFPTGSFSPNSPLSAFDGQNPNGNWTINISDNAGTDTGSARAFSLVIGSVCSTPTNTPTSTPTAAGTPAVSGTVIYGNAISGPTPPRFVSNVTINGTGSPNVSTTTTAPGATAGQYSLTGFGAGSYTVAPTKTGGVNNITSFDAAKIAQHVAGISLLTGNALVVADVSGNNSVTSFDAANIANFVVVASPAGSSGTWRFYTTPNVPFPPGATATSRTYPSVTTSIVGQDYTGLLMGEVSGNWNNTGARPVGNGSGSGSESSRGAPERSMAIAAPRLVTPADDDVIIPVSVDGVAADKGIISYEFDLRYDPSVIQPQEDAVDIAGTVSRGLSVAVNPKEAGLLRVALYGPVPIDGNGVLLNLRFTAVGAPGSVSPLTWERLMFNEGELATTAADGQVELSSTAPNQAEISGRLLTAMGQGISHARVTLTDTAGQSRSVLSNGFGLYRFGNLQVGQTYTISVDSKRYTFTPMTVSVIDQLVGVDMIAAL